MITAAKIAAGSITLTRTVPFFLSSIGYKVNPDKPTELINCNGHPYYPITLNDELHYNDGHYWELILQAAYEAGKSQTAKARAIPRCEEDPASVRGLTKFCKACPVCNMGPCALDNRK